MILKFLKLSRAYLSKSDKHRFTDYNKTAYHALDNQEHPSCEYIGIVVVRLSTQRKCFWQKEMR